MRRIISLAISVLFLGSLFGLYEVVGSSSYNLATRDCAGEDIATLMTATETFTGK